jgi:peptidoglycan L-alanyl-D-glutamate endopeptidase CwlK
LDWVDTDNGVANNRYKNMYSGWVLLYFVLGCSVLAAVIFPHWREALRGRLHAWWHRALTQRRRVERGVHNSQTRLTAEATQRAQAVQAWWRSRWMWAALTLGLLVAPLAVVTAWGLMGTRSLDGFDDRIDPGNQQVVHLLRGEQLVPPPPLPPDVFTTAEVEVIRPMLSSADRRWDQMDADFVQRLLRVFKIMKDEHGYDMALLEGWRSPERQALLAAKGSNVTMAGAWQSYHQYGLAADCAFLRDGKLVISEKDAWAMRGYQLYGEVAARVGLTWGGHWQMMDLGHVEWRKDSAKAAIRSAGYQ